jgi:transcriptional regulator with XRE-family HTH domain
MTGADLKTMLTSLGLRQHQAARLLGVTTRAVGMWANEEREIPGPVTAYLGLLAALPSALRIKEIARIQENVEMFDGMYRMDLVGAADRGLGVLILQDGRVFGSDTVVSYDGTYAPTGKPGCVMMKVRVSVPPGTPLVQGLMSGHHGFSFDVGPEEVALGRPGGATFTVMTPVGGPNGAVTVHLMKLRNLPD